MRESNIQTQIETFLRYQQNLGKLVYIKNNSGAFSTKKGGFYKFGKKGSSDFLVFLPMGNTLHLEIKNEKGRQSPDQKKYQAKIESLGHDYKLCRSLEEVQQIIENYLILYSDNIR